MAATKVKVIELAKELGVTSKDLMLAAEEMGHKGVRAMTPLDAKLANELRTKLGKGREFPEEPVKLKRVTKPKAPTDDGAVVDGAEVVAKKPSRAKKSKPADAADEVPAEVKPAATIVKPRPAEITGEPGRRRPRGPSRRSCRSDRSSARHRRPRPRDHRASPPDRSRLRG